MEEHPEGGLDSLRGVIDERWSELDFEAPWLEQKERRWAEQLTGRLDAYLRRVNEEGGRALGAEVRFELEIDLEAEGGPRVISVRTGDEGTGASPQGQSGSAGASVSAPQEPQESAPHARAILSGSIDRVEAYPPRRGEAVPADPDDPDRGRIVIIDLKTGRSESRVTDAAVADHAQLAAYQLAFDAGAVSAEKEETLAGSRLVVLSKALKGGNYRIAHQGPHDAEARAAFLARLAEDARGMADDHFLAQIDTHCHSDRFAVCRIHTVKAVSAS